MLHAKMPLSTLMMSYKKFLIYTDKKQWIVKNEKVQESGKHVRNDVAKTDG